MHLVSSTHTCTSWNLKFSSFATRRREGIRKDVRSINIDISTVSLCHPPRISKHLRGCFLRKFKMRRYFCAGLGVGLRKLRYCQDSAWKHVSWKYCITSMAEFVSGAGGLVLWLHKLYFILVINAETFPKNATLSSCSTSSVLYRETYLLSLF